MEKTHNLEVPGSSPGWSTRKIKQLRNFVTAFFINSVCYFSLASAKIQWNAQTFQIFSIYLQQFLIIVVIGIVFIIEKVLLKLSSSLKFSQSLKWYEDDDSSTTS